MRTTLSNQAIRRIAQAISSSDNSPKVYVGTYRKYNNGSIKGAWLDLDDYGDAEEFYDAAMELHSDEEDPELMFQDWENIPDWAISESHIDPKFFEVKELTSDWDDERRKAFDVFQNWAGYDLSKTDADEVVSSFEDSYRGQFRSLEDYAYGFIEDIGMENINNMEFYFDVEKFGRDLGYDGYNEVTEDEAEASPDEYREGAGVYDPEGQYTGYRTLEDLAESFMDEGIVGKDTMQQYFDYEKFARDLELGGDIYYDDKTGFVFESI